MSNGTTATLFFENIYVRVIGVITAGLIIGGLLWHEATFRANLQHDLKELKSDLKILTSRETPKKLSDIENRLNGLEEAITKSKFDAWTLTQMKLWMLETEKLNKTWKASPIVGGEK